MAKTENICAHTRTSITRVSHGKSRLGRGRQLVTIKSITIGYIAYSISMHTTISVFAS
jgi:hypothetical protein